MVVQVIGRDFCAGVIFERDYIIEAAPILRKFIGWHRYRFASYWRARGARIQVVW